MYEFPVCGTGCLASPPDPRDHFDDKVAAAAPEASESFHTDTSMIPIRYQAHQPTCTKEAVMRWLEWRIWKDTGKYEKLSTAFLEIATKRFIDQNEFPGSDIRNVLKAAQKYGVCSEAIFPTNYDLDYKSFIRQEIPKEAFDDAATRKIGRYYQIPVDDLMLRASIEIHGMVIVRFDLGKEWYTSVDGRTTWAEDLIDPLRPPADVISGHAVALVGFDFSSIKKFFGDNSWSKVWDRMGSFTHIFDKYKPTEAWVATMEPIPKSSELTVEASVAQKLLNILRIIGIIK